MNTMPDMDFETYSEAGMVFDQESQKWKLIQKTGKTGIAIVGAARYSEHPSTKVLSLAYDLKEGVGPRLWLPGLPDPTDLFDHIKAGGLIEAWNSMFEYNIWRNVCHSRMGWPALPLGQLRDAMAKAKAWALPGALGGVAKVLNTPIQKGAEGKRLINKFCKPRTPTKKDPRQRIHMSQEPEDAGAMCEYNIGDIQAESACSKAMPDLSPDELKLWLLDQDINARGCPVDENSVNNCADIVLQALKQYNAEIYRITGGAVSKGSEVKKLKEWLEDMGVTGLENMQKATVEDALTWPCVLARPSCHRVLELRQIVGGASIKKLFSMQNRVTRDGTLKELFMFCGAERTGRFAGRGPQPQNLPNSGPSVIPCKCGAYYAAVVAACPACHKATEWNAPAKDWCVEAVEFCLKLAESRDLGLLEAYFVDAVKAISGCLRGLFCAPEGYELICSDYSAIEAVVLAELAGEEWRQEVFRTHGKIYEMSASKITGIPFEDFAKHKKETGEHHPMRKKIGKVAELASGYGGWIGAWKAFGADEHFADDKEMKDAILKWRDESPAIVEFWGGQIRKHPRRWEFRRESYGLEGAAVAAVQNPGTCYAYRGITYGVKDDVLYCLLPSGRKLSYHKPILTPTTCRMSQMKIFQISYMGWNSDYTKGPQGWIRMSTYSGKLTENVVQAVARDILTHAMSGVSEAGYPIVLHIHDELASIVPLGEGSIQEYEGIMGSLPAWAKDWPVHAAGGWRGRRYRKG